ncbi:MAG: hypothetical protein JWM91_729, partial [Rhodospirillales bacterium]|nr:hypothetical protein [Rhodospirillales bacterium]
MIISASGRKRKTDSVPQIPQVNH